MASKKVFVDLNLQPGSNVNIQNNLSVSGTSTLKTADLRQILLTKEFLNLGSTNFQTVDCTISPDTSILVILGNSKGNTIRTISSTTGSFADGKILEVQNQTVSYVSLNIKTPGNNIEYAFSYYYELSNLNFAGGTDAYSSTARAIYGALSTPSNENTSILTEIKPFETIKFRFETLNMVWIDVGKNHTLPNYIHFYVDTQTEFSYTSATSDFNIQLNNPFGVNNINFKLGAVASNSTSLSYPFYPSVFEYSDQLLNQSSDKISARFFSATLNKSALETFRASNRYIHFFIIL